MTVQTSGVWVKVAVASSQGVDSLLCWSNLLASSADGAATSFELELETTAASLWTTYAELWFDLSARSTGRHADANVLVLGAAALGDVSDTNLLVGVSAGNLVAPLCTSKALLASTSASNLQAYTLVYTGCYASGCPACAVLHGLVCDTLCACLDTLSNVFAAYVSLFNTFADSSGSAS